MKSTDSHVAAFLVKLGNLTAGTMNAEDARTKLEAYVPMLRQEFGADRFTPDSLAYVASRCKFFPAYGELCLLLREWWNANRPYPIALPAPTIPDRIPPTEHELAAVEALTRQCKAILTPEPGQFSNRQPCRSVPMSDGQLLGMWEQALAQWLPGASARVASLRARIKGEERHAAE